MVERMWGKGNTLALLVGVQTGTTALYISMAISQKIRKQPPSRPSNTTFGYIHKGCSVLPQGHVLNYVHSSIVCHSQNLEITEMLLDQRMDKENVVHFYTMEHYTAEKNNNVLKFVANVWI